MSKYYCIKLVNIQGEKWSFEYELAESYMQQNDGADFKIYNPYFQGEEVHEVIQNVDFNYHKGFYIFGSKNTILIEEIARRKTHVSTITVFDIIDGNELVLYGSEYFLQLLLEMKIDLIIGKPNYILSKMPGLVSIVSKIYNMKNMEFITTPDFKSQHPRLSVELPKSLLEFMEYQIAGLGNSIEDILWGTDNLINCWEYYLKGQYAKSFENTYKNVPAVIVGAGPSLDKNCQLLHNIKNKALVFAVDAAIDTLDGIGFVPDTYTTLERSDEPTRFYTKHNISDKTCFVGANIIVGDVLKEYDKWIFTGRNGDGFFRSFVQHLGNVNLDIGMNVANVPFSFAKYLGCDPIILVGLDLAYTGGATHVKNIADNMTDFIKGFYDNYKTYVEDQEGKLVETYIYFLYAKLWFEKRLAADASITCFNATEGGANINNATNMKLEDVIILLEDKPDIDERIYQKYEKLDKTSREKEIMTKDAKLFIESLSEDVKELMKTADIAKNHLVDNEKFGRVGRVESNRTNIDKILEKSAQMRFLFQPVYIGYNRELHSFPVFLESNDEQRLVDMSLHYYDNLSKVGEKLLETIEIYNDILNTHLGILGGGSHA